MMHHEVGSAKDIKLEEKNVRALFVQIKNHQAENPPRNMSFSPLGRRGSTLQKHLDGIEYIALYLNFGGQDKEAKLLDADPEGHYTPLEAGDDDRRGIYVRGFGREVYPCLHVGENQTEHATTAAMRRILQTAKNISLRASSNISRSALQSIFRLSFKREDGNDLVYVPEREEFGEAMEEV